MSPDDMLTILRALGREGVAYKLVGGMAMAVHGLARATEDIDLFVEPSDENIARLRRALWSLYDDPAIAELVAEEFRGEYPAVQYIPPGAAYHLDLLARLGDAFDFDGVEAEQKLAGGVMVTVATPRMLHEMKRDTVRVQDRADAARIALAFGLED
jgi:hypothetical protein